MMARLKLSSGREVPIVRIDLENIYCSVLEGTPEMVAKLQRRSLRDAIGKRFRDTDALLIIDAQEPTLPQYRCVAHFQSLPVKAENCYSLLLVCWFMEGINRNLQEAARQVLDSINWEAHAVDVHADEI